jgi:hypothetical protein
MGKTTTTKYLSSQASKLLEAHFRQSDATTWKR